MTGPLRLRLLEQRLMLGRSAGLPQATARMVIGVDGGVAGAALDRIRAGVVTLRPGRYLYGINESDWPTAFLIDDALGGVDPLWMLGSWIGALTVALQRWAGDPAWRGRVLSAHGGTIELAVPWRREALVGDTVRLALQLVELWTGTPADRWPDTSLAIEQGMQQARAGGLHIDALRLALAGSGRGIPVDLRPGHVQYGWGARQVRLHSTITGRTGYVAASTAQNKIHAVRLLAAAGLPVPDGSVAADADEAVRVAVSLGWPVVVKPGNQEQGRGVVADIRDEADLRRAFDAANRFSPGGVVVEKHVDGADYRLQVVKGQCISVHLLTPGGIIGDGVSTVGQLVEGLNADPRRGVDGRFFMKRIALDGDALDCLARQRLTVDSVPFEGQWVALRRIANVSAGGAAEDVTDTVHPENRRMAERAARIVGLDVAGLDFLTPDIGRSWREVGGAICEINSFPELGDPVRDTHGRILDLLLEGTTGRIPTALIAGGPSAAVSAELLQHIWAASGFVAGLCTPEVVRVGEEIVAMGDAGGLPRAGLVLNDPAVQTAVLQIGADELAAIGHPCDRYDVAALVDLGEESTELYAEVLHRAGAVVADVCDPVAMDLLRSIDGPQRQTLISRDPLAPRLVEHLRAGGRGVFVARRGDRDWLVTATGDAEAPVLPIGAFPGADARSALFASALAFEQGRDLADIRTAFGASVPPTTGVENAPDHPR